MSYLIVRHLHITCAIVTITLFVLRGSLALARVDWRRWQPLRWLPHLNDTVLLSAAVWLALHSGQYPLQQTWLTAKLVGLVVYIGLGRQALKADLTPTQRLPWFLAALAAVSYIVWVAHSRQALPW